MLDRDNMILSLASRLNTTENFKDDIEDILKYLAEEIKLTRICIYIFDPNIQHIPLFTISSLKCHFNLQNKIYRCPFMISQVKETIKSGKCFSSSDLAEIGNNESNYYKKSIVSVLILPLKIGDNIYGMINYSNNHEYVWNQEEILLFKIITEIISIAYDRNCHFHARLEAEKKQTLIMQMAENISQHAFFGTLISSIAHEINQPLNASSFAVDGMLYWENENNKISNEDVTDVLQLISEQIQRIDDIIKHINTLYRQITGKEIITDDIDTMINNILGLMKQQMFVHAIKVTMNLHDSLSTIVRCPIQLIHIFTILMTAIINELKNNDRKNKVISIFLRYEDGNLILKIIYTSLAIPKDNIDQLSNTFSTDVSYTLLDYGFIIINSMVARIGGSISARNCDKGNNCINVSIPVKIVSRDAHEYSSG